jgi:hypothetical protein
MENGSTSLKGVKMHKVLLLTLVLILGASMVFAQAGSIGIFSDQTGTSCNLTATPGLVYYYFLHVNTTGAKAAAWSAPVPTCFPAVFLGYLTEDPFYFCIGDPETGITVAYHGCKTGTFLIMKALYNVLGAATDCCRWSIGPDPHVPSGTIEGADCSGNMIHPSGGYAILNATAACNCDIYVPTENTTWGQVKALYAE